jgi:hypothetical protein
MFIAIAVYQSNLIVGLYGLAGLLVGIIYGFMILIPSKYQLWVSDILIGSMWGSLVMLTIY